jgi:zinc transporter ZupT
MDSTSLFWRAATLVLVGMVGGIVGAFGSGRHRDTAAFLVQFAAGAFVAVTVLHVLPESAHHIGWPGALAATGGGLAFCYLMTRWAGGGCPGCTESGDKSAAVFGRLRLGLGSPLLVVLAIHALLDGFALAGTGTHAHGHEHGHAHAHGHGHEAEMLSMAVLAHKLPEGLAIATVSRAAGWSIPGALALTAGVQAFTFGGVYSGVWVGRLDDIWLGLGLALVAGSFFYVASVAIGAARSQSSPTSHAGVAAAGALLIVLITLAFGTGH